ncbi:hypothetical protein CLU79DRAFT_765986, partial [Phycomyces nitens]
MFSSKNVDPQELPDPFVTSLRVFTPPESSISNTIKSTVPPPASQIINRWPWVRL